MSHDHIFFQHINSKGLLKVWSIILWFLSCLCQNICNMGYRLIYIFYVNVSFYVNGLKLPKKKKNCSDHLDNKTLTMCDMACVFL